MFFLSVIITNGCFLFPQKVISLLTGYLFICMAAILLLYLLHFFLGFIIHLKKLTIEAVLLFLCVLQDPSVTAREK